MAALVCSYEPAELGHAALRTEVDTGSNLTPRLWHLIERAEFREVIAESGKLGLAEHPLIAARHLRNAFKAYLETKEAATLLKSASTVASLGKAAHPSLEIVKTSAELLANFTDSIEAYRPPFMPLGPAMQGVHRVALANISSEAVPVKGSIFSFATHTAARERMSWLSVGEEQKLEREAADLERSRKRWEEAQKAVGRFF
jgi:hypothetical protein